MLHQSPNAESHPHKPSYGVSHFVGKFNRRESDSTNSSSAPNPNPFYSFPISAPRITSSVPTAVSTPRSARKFSQTAAHIADPLSTLSRAFDFNSCCRPCTHKQVDQSWFQYLVCKCCNCCGNNNRSISTLMGTETPAENSTWSFLLFCAQYCALPWNIMKFICSIILLFLSNIQNAFCPPSVDAAFNGLFIMAFVILMLDIIRLSFFDSSYLPLQLWKWKNKSAREKPDMFSTSQDGPFLRLGSFLFWCDLLSTLTLIYDISYLSTDLAAMPFIHFRTDSYGSPLYSEDILDGSKRLKFDRSLAVFVALARTARIARFLAPASVTKISAKVNWCFVPHVLGMSYQSCCTGNINREKNRCDYSYCGWSIFSRNRYNNAVIERRNSAAAAIQTAWRSFKDVASEPGSERNNDGDTKHSSTNANIGRRRNIFLRALSSRRFFVGSDTNKASSQFKNHNSNSLANETQVGTAMRDLTGHRVAFGILITIIATILFTYFEDNPTKSAVALYIHNLSRQNLDLGKFMLNDIYAEEDLISFYFCNETSSLDKFHSNVASKNCDLMNSIVFNSMKSGSSLGSNISMGMRLVSESSMNEAVESFDDKASSSQLRHSEMLNITICTLENDSCIAISETYFDISEGQSLTAAISLAFTVFVLVIWFFAVNSFVGPLMILVVIPIERMMRLLRMMMKDPLGYQSSKRYKAFVLEEKDLIKNTLWNKEVLKGMETSFLMSTIQRIGSLMRVGFGTAGVEIIRGSLERGGNNKDIIFKNLQGSSVSCIFMFCDVRGFTDATECLQEEIFAFTNRIAAVVHSYCHTYGGAASQNAGDAFLITWKLDAPDVTSSKHMSKSIGMTRRFSTNIAPGQNAFKSSLYSSKQQADKALLSCVKICMALQVDDFFLATLSPHASKKIREKVESKRSGPIVQMGFGLHAGRAVQGAIGSQMKLDPTYIGSNVNFAEFLESSSKDYGVPVVMSHLFVQLLKPMLRVKCRKIDRICFDDEALEDILADLPDTEEKDVIDLYTLDFDIPSLLQSKSIGQGGTTSLFLPSGPSIYRESIWRSQEFRSLFQRFHGDFFQRYNDGLNAYYSRDWDHAQECFESLRNEFNDGPSQHFLDLMKELGKPPKNFASYRVVS